MQRRLLLPLIVAIGLAARDPLPTPIMRVVEPVTAKTGDVVTVTGENLGTDYVLAVYLTDRTTQRKVEVLEQSNTIVKFRVPDLKQGKYWLMVMANLDEPVLIEEPCHVVIESATPSAPPTE